MRAALLLLSLTWSLAAQAAESWDRWQVLLWQDRTPAQMQGLAALGFTGAKLRATGGNVDAEGRAVRLRLGLRYYLENIATDFYAPYHRFTPGESVTWLFDAMRARRRADPEEPAATVRQPGLSDPAWQEQVRLRLRRVVAEEAVNRPLFYNLADESGIADLAAAWDFDTAPGSLAAFRAWLRTRYASLDALNREWGAGFAAWDAVLPELTDAAIRRTDENFASWSDFKQWMDTAFADAVRMGAEAVHQSGALHQGGGALAALEGGQVPGWGGYDYSLLAPAVDVMEIYDAGDALDLAMAFNPALIPLRTSFGSGPREVHAAWRNVLHGGRGMVVWDEADDVVGATGEPGPRGRAIAALAGSIAPVFDWLRQARPDPDAVAVLASQASFRVRWLLDRRAGDHDWTARDAERENDDNAWRASRRMLLRRLGELGVQPRLVSDAMLEQGALRDGGFRVLFLPHAIALSDAEVAAIAAFRQAGGTVLADTEPGLFDGHGRRRDSLPLPDVPHPLAVRPDGEETSPAVLVALADLLRAAGAVPRAVILGEDGQAATGIELRWFRHGIGTIVTIQAGRPWGAGRHVKLLLPKPMVVRDLRRGGPTPVLMHIDLVMHQIEPTILLLAPPPAGSP